MIQSDETTTGFYVTEPKYKSKMQIGNSFLVVYHIKHFNWFRKLMYKIAFDIKIEDVGDSNE